MKPRLVPTLTDEQRQYADEIKSAAPHALQEVESGTGMASKFESYERHDFPRELYRAEAVKRGDDIHYHFFMHEVVVDATTDPPTTKSVPFPPRFQEKLTAALLEVFKLEDRLALSWFAELGSWGALAKGFAHPTADIPRLTNRLLLALDAKLAGSS